MRRSPTERGFESELESWDFPLMACSSIRKLPIETAFAQSKDLTRLDRTRSVYYFSLSDYLLRGRTEVEILVSCRDGNAHLQRILE
jgi:hypothetical protein